MRRDEKERKGIPHMTCRLRLTYMMSMEISREKESVVDTEEVSS
jgi:hypothetical protein